MLRKPKAAGCSAEDGEKWLADVSVCIGDAGLSATDKLNLKRIVTAYGGTVSYLVHPKTTHLVTGEEEVRVCSQKVRTADRYGVRLITPAWLLDSAAAGSRQDEAPFLLSSAAVAAVAEQQQTENDRNDNATVSIITSTTSTSATATATDGDAATSSLSLSSSLSWSFGSIAAEASASTGTLGSASLVNRPRGTWLTPAATSLLDHFPLFSLDSEASPSSTASLPSSSSSSSLTSTADDEASSLAPAAAAADDDVSTAQAEQGDAESAKKEGWARKLEERQKQLREVSDRLRAAKREYDQEQHRSIRRHKTEADRELEQSFSADAKARKRERLEALRHQRLAKLREGWLAELARRKKRDDEKAEEKRKRREAWEEKQREKERRRQDYEQKKREWESKQAERAQKQREWDAQILRWEEQKRSELYKKFFVGNLKWKDITLEDMGSETAVEFARQKRWDRLRAVLASFGPITRIKEHWDRHFVFVVYEEREHAEKAMEVLSSWDERVKIVTAIRKQLLDEAQPLVYTPTPDFYLRWPTKEPHPDPEEEKKKAEAEAAAKLKEEQRLQAEAQEIADGWEKKKKPAKKSKKNENDDDAEKKADDADAPPDVRPPKQQRGLDGKSKKKREKRKLKEAEKRELEKKKGKGKGKGRSQDRRPPTPADRPARPRPAPTDADAKPAGTAVAAPSRGRGGRGMRGMSRGGRGAPPRRCALPSVAVAYAAGSVAEAADAVVEADVVAAGESRRNNSNRAVNSEHELPADVLLHVLSFVVAGAGSAREAAAALCRVGGACSALREVASSDHLWRRLARDADQHWRLRPLPATDDQRAGWVRIVRAAHIKPKPKPTASRLFDDDDDLFDAVHVKTDPLNAVALQEPEPEPELEVEVPTTYKQLYMSMPPPPFLYTDERWFDDACRMATLVVHAAVRHPQPKRPGANSLFGSDDDDDDDIFAPPTSRSGVLEVLQELHGRNPSLSATINLTSPFRATPGQVGVWMLVCSGGRYFNVGPPSSSPFPLAAWTAAGGLRERFERVRAQETEDRRGYVSTTATASQAHDGHDYVCCGSGGIFDDEEPYKVWHVKSWHEGELCRQLKCPAAARRQVAGLHVWPPELGTVAGWADGHFLTQDAGGLLYFHLVNGAVLSSWRIGSKGVVQESFCRAPVSRLTPSDVFAATATELPSGQKVMTHDQFLAGLELWTNRAKQCVVSPTGVHVRYDHGRGFPHVRQCLVWTRDDPSPAPAEFVLDSNGDKVALLRG